jgi:hypothetical protein
MATAKTATKNTTAAATVNVATFTGGKCYLRTAMGMG